jgi:two-component system, response regulator PdtaR
MDNPLTLLPVSDKNLNSALCILIVEDDYLIATVIEETLLELGHHVVGIASSGEEAIAISRDKAPHLALMDIRLGGRMDGLETARALRRIYGVRSLYLSGHVDEHVMARMAQTYPLGFVQKPYSAHQLRSALEIAQKRLSQSQGAVVVPGSLLR